MRRQTSKQRSTVGDPTLNRPRYSRSGMVQQFDDGRTCSQPGCDTKLSRYNSLPTCAIHGDDDGRSS